jgi:hypothetical protein
VLFDYEPGNDLRDIFAFGAYRAGHAGVAAQSSQPTSVSSQDRTFLTRHSYLYNLLRAALGTEKGHHDNDPRSTKLPSKHTIDFRYAVRFGDRSIAFNPHNRDQDEPYYAMALARGVLDVKSLRLPIERFAQLAQQYGFTAVVTYTPPANTVYRNFIQFEDPALDEIMRRGDERQREAIAAAAAEFGLPFIDLTPALQEAAAALEDRQLLYFKENLHITPAGHRVIAETLEKRLPALLQR